MRTQHQPNAAMQETTPAPELKPCPFCASPAVIDNQFVGCPECEIGFSCKDNHPLASPARTIILMISAFMHGIIGLVRKSRLKRMNSDYATQHQPNAAMQETTPAPSPAPECYLGRCPICGINPVVSRVFDGKSHGFLVQGFGLPESCRFCNFELRSDIFSTLEDAKKAWYWKVSGYNRKYKEFFNYVIAFHLILASTCMIFGILGMIDFLK